MANEVTNCASREHMFILNTRIERMTQYEYEHILNRAITRISGGVCINARDIRSEGMNY